MTEAQARHLLSSSRSLCVRYRSRADGTILFAPAVARRGPLVWLAALAACAPHGDDEGGMCDESSPEGACDETSTVPPPTIPLTDPELGPMHRRVVVPALPPDALEARWHSIDSEVTVGALVKDIGQEIPLPIDAVPTEIEHRPIRITRWFGERRESRRERGAERKRHRLAAKLERQRARASKRELRAAERHERKMAARWRRAFRRLFRGER